MVDRYSVYFFCNVSSEENKYLTIQAVNSIEDCARLIHATIDARQKEKKRKS
jgi:hypothetical protein